MSVVQALTVVLAVPHSQLPDKRMCGGGYSGGRYFGSRVVEVRLSFVSDVVIDGDCEGRSRMMGSPVRPQALSATTWFSCLSAAVANHRSGTAVMEVIFNLAMSRRPFSL